MHSAKLTIQGVRGAADALRQLAAEAASRPAANVPRERMNGLFTQHLVGSHVAAITIPARKKKGWISVIEPRPGTHASAGQDRTHFQGRDAALAHSRAYAAKLAASHT